MSLSISPALRHEAAANFKLAAPLIAAQIAAVGMGAIDTMFAGRLGAQALAAVAVGVNYNILFFAMALGLLMACSPIVAQLRGAGRAAAEIGAFMRRARRLGLIVALVWFVAVNASAAPALRLLDLGGDTAQLAVRFVRYLSASAFGFSMYFALRSCAEGAGQTRPIFVAGVIGLAANVLLDWLLVFGHFGLPALGAIGCGIATTLSSALMAAVLWRSYRYEPRLRIYLDAAQPCAHGMRSILRLGGPIALILLAESGLFVLAALLMARFGDAVVAAYQVAINFASLLFMIPLGVGQGTAVRVGLAAGAHEYLAARFRGVVGIGMGLINALSNAAIMLLFGGVIVAIYTHDAAIAAQATHFLVLAAVFQFFDGVQVTANGALRGLKDTRVPAVITLVAYWLVGLPVAWSLAFTQQIGADGLWWGLTAGLGIAAIGLSWRFVHNSGAHVRATDSDVLSI
ncbi:MAG: family efflux transporter [Nevskia sp.]|nr:family efflux transporter [Nevskia sp.]